MATYIIVPDGGVAVGGCVEAWHVLTFTYEFAENDAAFYKRKAENGILKEVVIKEVQIGQDQYNKDFIVYKDTWNAIWNENELIPEQEAINTAISYYETQITQLQLVEFCVRDNDDILFSDILQEMLNAIERLESITDIRIPVGGSYERIVRLGR